MGKIIDMATRQTIEPITPSEPEQRPLPTLETVPQTIKREPRQEARRVDLVETAQYIRAALKKAFPGQKFTVRTSRYSGGSSIDIGWIDGPTESEVDAIGKRFAGATWDSSTESTTYRDATLNGERLHFSVDHVMSQRTESADLLRACAARVAKEWGCDAPVVMTKTYKYGGKVHESAWIDRLGPIVDPVDPYHKTAGDKVMALARKTSAYKKPSA